MAIDYTTISEDTIIGICKYCAKLRGHILSETFGRSVVRIPGNCIAKYGLGIAATEARAQSLASSVLETSIVRVPRVHRFFESSHETLGHIGYLIMDLVAGRPLEPRDLRPDTTSQIANAITLVNSIAGEEPGPVGGGCARGLLWSEYGSSESFITKADLQRWLNRRLETFNKHINISEHDLVLCHLDLAPRNILQGEHGTFYIIDWEAAGFYPSFFERWSLQFLRHLGDADFFDQLDEFLPPLDDEDRSCITKLNSVYQACTRFAPYVAAKNVEDFY